MEITIEKENGEPMSEKEAADLLRFIRRQLKPLIEVDEEDCPVSKPDIFHHDVGIILKEDDSYVYAAAFCPGISKDRLEVQIDGWELIIRTKPADPDAENNDDSRRFPWKFFEDLSYEGETELPTEVIAEQATAELSNGLLYIKLPKTEAVKPKTVAVK